MQSQASFTFHNYFARNDSTFDKLAKLQLSEDQLRAEAEEEEGIVKWCQPVSVISDESSSSDDERVKLCYPVHGEGHKFSDGIVWETIEEEEE